MSDIRYALRKLEFPFCAREGLNRIEHLMGGRNVPTSKQLDLATDLVREFVFCEVEYRDTRRPAGLNPLQELQLLDIFCEYFSGPLNEIAKNAIFLTLFSGPESWKRMKFMHKLASMAISASMASVLHILGTWMLQTGCTSPASLQLAHSLVRDYFVLHPSHEGPLKVLPNIAPQFVANFMTAVVEIYLKEGPAGTFSPPPKSLLELITFWVSTNPKLCTSAQPNPGTAATVISPLAGLIQWCSLAPLFISYCENDVEIKESNVSPIKKIKLEKPIMVSEDNPSYNTNTEFQLYTKLHLGVLQSLNECKRPTNPVSTINSQHLAQIVPAVLKKLELSKSPGNISLSEGSIQLCLERLAQATQIALASGCIYGNIPSLMSALSSLPECRILKIIIKNQQQKS